MKQLIQGINYYFNTPKNRLFTPYFEKENDVDRLIRIHGIAAFLFCPLFALFIHFTEVPSLYEYFSLSYTVLFPLYAVVCRYISLLNQKLVYFFFLHLFILSIIAFYWFYRLDYPTDHLYYFSFLYTLTLYVTQRLIPAIIYNLLIAGMLITGFILKYPETFSVKAIFSFFILFAAASVLVLLSRERMIKTVEDYSDYLKQILNNPGTGFILFTTLLNHKLLVDFNDQACYLTEKNSKEIERVFSFFDESDLHKIDQLTLGEQFKKAVDLSVSDKTTRYLEFNVSIMQLKNGFYHLIRIVDITSKVHEKELELRAQLAEENNLVLSSEVSQKIDAQRLLKEQLIRMNSIFDKSASTMLAVISTDFKIIRCNTFFLQYFKHHIDTDVVEGVKLDYFLKTVFDSKYEKIVNRAIKQIKRGISTQFETSVITDSHEYFIEIYLNPIMNIEGTLIEISMVAHDITLKKKQEEKIIESLHEKELLLKEIHHRVKNNLQIISSILSLQSSSINDDYVLEIFRESRNRIYTMATIHENLYQSEQFSSIHFASYLKKLVGNVLGSYQSSELYISIKYDLQEIELSLDQAIPCGLIVNELLTNVVKYAFPENKNGQLIIQLNEINSKIYLNIADNGVGLPVDLDIYKTTTLGFQLVTTLIGQLDGEFKVSTQNGTKFLIIFDKTKL